MRWAEGQRRRIKEPRQGWRERAGSVISRLPAPPGHYSSTGRTPRAAPGNEVSACEMRSGLCLLLHWLL
ncbi:hypothetical protein ACOMHN_008080 [Nucella lapillus]